MDFSDKRVTVTGRMPDAERLAICRLQVTTYRRDTRGVQ